MPITLYVQVARTLRTSLTDHHPLSRLEGNKSYDRIRTMTLVAGWIRRMKSWSMAAPKIIIQSQHWVDWATFQPRAQSGLWKGLKDFMSVIGISERSMTSFWPWHFDFTQKYMKSDTMSRLNPSNINWMFLLLGAAKRTYGIAAQKMNTSSLWTPKKKTKLAKRGGTRLMWWNIQSCGTRANADIAS